MASRMPLGMKPGGLEDLGYLPAGGPSAICHVPQMLRQNFRYALSHSM